MINLEIPKKFKPLATQANQVATEVFRPISRRYDEAEHSYPKELDMLASLIDGMNEGSDNAAGAGGVVAALVHPVDQRGEHVELLRVGVLGLVVAARDRSEDLGRDLVGLGGQGLELLRYLEVDHRLPFALGPQGAKRAGRPPSRPLRGGRGTSARPGAP